MSSRIANLKRLEMILLVVGVALVGFAAVVYFGGRVYLLLFVQKFPVETQFPHADR